MRSEHRKQYVLGGIYLVAVAALIVSVFVMLSHTEDGDISLTDTWSERCGWRYEILEDGQMRPIEPGFAEDTFGPILPDGVEVVRITRTMTEELPNAELDWMVGYEGVELSLDGELFYSDFSWVEREDSGVLHIDREDWEQLDRELGETVRHVRISLPTDYSGRELSVTTYFREEREKRLPVYPSIGVENTSSISQIAFSVREVTAMTVYATLTLLIAAIFLLDIPNDVFDPKTLFISLYFLMLFLEEANSSYAGLYSELKGRNVLTALYGLQVTPLYLYLLLRLKRWWKYPLCGVVGIWALREFAWQFISTFREPMDVARTTAPWSLLILLMVAGTCLFDAFDRDRRALRDGKSAAFYALLAIGIITVYVFNRIQAWGSVREYIEDGILVALRMGNYEPIVSIFSHMTSIMALIVVVVKFAQRTLRTQREVSVLKERGRLTLENYSRLLAAQEATGAARHEMRHHMTALSAILESGDLERARRYVSSVESELDSLPPGRYSHNLLVNVIAGNYLDRARAEGIRVEYKLAVPPELAIADEDLSVFLSNLLQNALEACERMDEAADRYIHIQMHLHKHFLFIKCENSACRAVPARDAQGEDESARPGGSHGYGLIAMRRIAEKYDSMLIIEEGPDSYSVRSNLCLTENRGGGRFMKRNGEEEQPLEGGGDAIGVVD